MVVPAPATGIADIGAEAGGGENGEGEIKVPSESALLACPSEDELAIVLAAGSLSLSAKPGAAAATLVAFTARATGGIVTGALSCSSRPQCAQRVAPAAFASSHAGQIIGDRGSGSVVRIMA